jgi:hypothetical protein
MRECRCGAKTRASCRAFTTSPTNHAASRKVPPTSPPFAVSCPASLPAWYEKPDSHSMLLTATSIHSCGTHSIWDLWHTRCQSLTPGTRHTLTWHTVWPIRKLTLCRMCDMLHTSGAVAVCTLGLGAHAATHAPTSAAATPPRAHHTTSQPPRPIATPDQMHLRRITLLLSPSVE